MSWETDSCVSCISCISWFIPSLLPTLDCRPLQSVPALPSPPSSLLPTFVIQKPLISRLFRVFRSYIRLPVCKRGKKQKTRRFPGWR